MEVEIDADVSFQNFDSEYLDEFPVIDTSVTYVEFFKKYLLKNQACLIKNVSCNWQSTKLWIQDGLPNFAALKAKYGDACVNIQDCSNTDYYAKREKWKCYEYLKYWQDFIENGYPKDEPLYYLKDWHLKNESANDDFYEIPLYFASDWLNEYLAENGLDDYRFVYMGVKGTNTPFHVDVMTSYSWSSNICGQKRWILFPPGEEDYLRDRLKNLPNDIENLKHDRKYFEVFQGPGDTIFVPSNWHHQVWNAKDTISINHNWINSCNLHIVWDSMEKNLTEVKHEISDCKDMDDFHDHCQLMLRASFTLNFLEFYKFISYIAHKRIKLIKNGTEVTLPHNRKLGKNHALFDLYSIKSTLTLFIKHEDIKTLSCIKNVKPEPEDLLHEIENILNVNKPELQL